MKLLGLHLYLAPYKEFHENALARNSKLVCDIEQLKHTNLTANAKIGDLNNELNRRKAIIADSNEKIAGLREENKQLSTEVAELKARILNYENDNCVMVSQEYLRQIEANSDRFIAEREKHNANRRKKRAAKKVASVKP